jgi:hypothetical protein
LYTVVDETFVRRPWKHYQATFYELEYDQLHADLQAKEKALLPTQGELATKIQQARAALESNAQDRKARQELEQVKNRLADLCRETPAKSRLTPSITNIKQPSTRRFTAARYKTESTNLSSRSPPLTYRSLSSEPVWTLQTEIKAMKPRSMRAEESAASGRRTINVSASA